MASIGTFTLTTDWVCLEDFVGTLDEATTYFIQNQGPDQLIMLESVSEPTGSDGLVCSEMKQCVYKYAPDDGKLYIRSAVSKSKAYISTDGKKTPVDNNNDEVVGE